MGSLNLGVCSPEVGRFLADVGFSEAAVVPLQGGGLHSVARLELGGRKVVLKLHAMPRPGEVRDRFQQELQFHRWVALRLPDSCPAILASDERARAILFEWIEGRHLRPVEIDERTVRAMASFLASINRVGTVPNPCGEAMGFATESGLSAGEHFEVVMQRTARLAGVACNSPEVAGMQAFVSGELGCVLRRWRSGMSSSDLSHRVEPVLSPSDFGFHNLLSRGDGRLCFLDFEHAGLDDPAKLCADFIRQPECPLSGRMGDVFLEEIESLGALGGGVACRTRQLLPLQAAKWATILLNPFLRGAADPEVLATRLVRARSYLRCLGLVE